MNIFKEVGLSWKGKEFTVPPDKVMGLIKVVEDVLTIEDLTGKGVKRAKLSEAFCAALRYAAICSGTTIKIDDMEVYQSLFGDSAMSNTSNTVYALLSMMIPPDHLQKKAKPKAPTKKKAASKKNK